VIVGTMNKKIVVLLVVFLFSLIAIIVGMVYYVNSKNSKNVTESLVTKEQNKIVLPSGPYFSMGPMRLTLKSVTGSKVNVSITVVLELEGEYMRYEIEAKRDRIRSSVEKILQSVDVEYLYSKRGKRFLAAEIQKRINSFLHDGKVQNVLLLFPSGN